MGEYSRNTRKEQGRETRASHARSQQGPSRTDASRGNASGRNPIPPKRPIPPAERTLRSSEQINRIREQGANRVQVAAPKQPVNQRKKPSSPQNAQSGGRRNTAKPSAGVSSSFRGAASGPNAPSVKECRQRSRKPAAQRPRQSANTHVRQQSRAASRPNRPDGRGAGSRASVPAPKSQRRGNHVAASASNQYVGRSMQPKKTFPTRKFAVVAVLLLALVVFGAVDGFVNGSKIYSGVTIGDVQVQGLTKDEAVNRVSGEYSQRVSSNVAMFFTTEDNLNNPKTSDSDANIEEQISYEESLQNRTQWTVPASQVEATLDVDALVEQAFEAGRGNGGVLGRLKAALFGWNVDLTCSYDETRLNELADQMTAAVGTKRVNYGIAVSNGVASVTNGNEGDEVTVDWLTQHLNETFLGAEEETKTVLEAIHMPLQVTERDAQHVADTVNASIAAGANFSCDGQNWNASSSDLGDLVTTDLTGEGDHWKLVPKFDESKTKNKLLSSLHSNIDSSGLEVSFSKDDAGQITVSSNAKGSAPMADETLANLNESFFVSDTRTQTPTIQVPSAEVPSSLSFDDAKSFGLITEVSSFTTQYSSGNEARVNNIHTAADLLNNSIAKANGGTWSFNDTAGEATPDKGYEAAGAIVGGEYSDAIGGGICQVATTVFNSVYLAGYPVEKRYNHTLYIESYPKGRDAAIAYPDLDLVWKNDTASDVLLVMTYTSTSVTATLWGVDPGYQVSTEYGDWQKGQPYSTVYKTDKSAAAGTEYVETTGVDGSSITIVRTVKDREGKILHEDAFTSTYAPKNKVIVKGAA